MVKNKSKNRKLIRRYRTFFIIGIVILAFQIFLAIKFLSINKTIAEPNDNKWLSENFDEEQEIEVNSASRYKANHDYEVSSVVQKLKTKDKTNHTYLLKYEDLEFVPACHISAKEAVSAINRAKTQLCKQLISNITCISNKNELYPTELKGSCPKGEFVAGKELGCFKDEKNFRLLTGYFGVNKNENSPKYCMKLCLQSGFPYAGVQYANECFCGVDEPLLTSKIPDSSCNLKCPGDPHATCGGYYTINIYHTGIKKFIPQIANTEPSNKIKTVKIVFLLTLNGRALRQVKRLLKILYHRDHYYYIHVDIRQDYLYRELLALEHLLPNVRLTRNRFATIWGGASLLEMLRACMWELLNIKEWKWDFVLNLSESDFPIKTIQKLSEFLSVNRNRNFVKSHGREVQRFIQKQGLDKTFVECEYRMWRIGDRGLPAGIQLDGGSDWIALSRNFVEYVADPVPDDLIIGLLKIFKHTLLPAESFFHTALRNSKYCDTYVDNNLHVTNWKRKLGCKCQYKHIVDWCGCSPNNFRPDDWSRILNTESRQLYFARKFEPIVNQAVILQLELWLQGLYTLTRDVPNLYGYWQNMYHHQDLEPLLNDGLFTLSNSVKRHSSKMLNTSDFCDINTLLEVTSYHYNDSYQYTLFKYDLAESYRLEVAVKPHGKSSVAKNSTLMSHLDVLTVTSDFDQKEQLSRNFLRSLFPFSEPILMYSFFQGPGSKVYNLTSIWLGPDGRLYDIVDFSVDSFSLTGYVKPGLKQPILPGIWTVKLIYKNSQIAESKFPIFPLGYLNGSPIKSHQITYLHSGSKENKEFKNSFGKFLPSIPQKTDMERLSLKNSEKTGTQLAQWVDELFLEFYRIKKMCESVGSLSSKKLCSEQTVRCEKSSWSSFAPDPKSAIGTINSTTKTFDIW